MIEITMFELLFYGLLQAVVVAIIVSRVSKTAKIIGPAIMWKSKKGLKWMNRISKMHPNFWNAYGDFGVILAFGVVGGLYVFRKRKDKVKLAALSALFLLAPFVGTFAASAFSGGFSGTLTRFLAGTDPMMNVMAIITLYFGGFATTLTYVLLANALGIVSGYLAGAPVVAGVGPLIPGVKVPGSPFPALPWYGWFAIVVVLVVHELSHGILTRVNKFRLKSTGVLFLGVIPFGAFVEPDEKQLKKAPIHKRMRVFSVGSVSNYFTYLAVLVLLLVVIQPVIAVSGLADAHKDYLDHPQINELVQGTEAYAVLEPGMKILSINGTETRSLADVHNMTSALGPNAHALIETDRGTFTLTLTGNAMIGISDLRDTYLPTKPGYLEWIGIALNMLYMIMLFNFLVGIMNLIPMAPLDGGLMMEGLVEHHTRSKKKARMAVKALSIFLLVLFLVNMLPLFALV